MGMMSEFKEFAVKGNMVDMAVGIIIGGGFGKIVASLVKDVIMPPIGLAMGGVDFSKLAVTLQKAVPAVNGAGGKEAVLLKWGVFVQTIVDFAIVAFCVFMIVKAINKMKREEPAAPEPDPEPPKQEVLLEEIRDLLKK